MCSGRAGHSYWLPKLEKKNSQNYLFRRKVRNKEKIIFLSEDSWQHIPLCISNPKSHRKTAKMVCILLQVSVYHITLALAVDPAPSLSSCISSNSQHC